jgi:hypothetical protein
MPGVFILAFAVFVAVVLIYVISGFLFRGYKLKNANETDFDFGQSDSMSNTNL